MRRDGVVLSAVILSITSFCVRADAGVQVWTGTGPLAKSIEAIARDPLDPSRMWAASFGAGVYRSLDGGATWTVHRTGLVNTYVRALAVNPHHPDSLFCGTNKGVSLSVDGGVTWTELLATPKSVRAIAVHPIRTAVIYAATYGYGIYKSLNGGATWSSINLGLVNTNVRDIALHPVNPDTLLAATGTGGGIHRSFNGGLTWSQVPDSTATDGAAEQVQFDRLDPQRIYVATLNRGVLRSSDGGDTWARINRGLTDYNTRALSVVDTIRYVGTAGSGVFYTTLNDTIWHAVSSGLSTPIVDALLSSPSDPAIAWAGTEGGGIFKTGNFGAAWTQVDGGLLTTAGFSLAVRPSTHIVYDGTGFGDQFWRSTDQGGTWTRAAYLFTHGSVRDVVPDPIGAQTLYLTSYGSGVYRSDDDGVTWFNPDSLNGSLVNVFVRPLVAWPGQTGHLFVGTGNGVYESTDGATTWTPRSVGLPASFSVRSMAVAPTLPTPTLYAGSDLSGAYRSQDGGLTWLSKSSGIVSPFIRTLHVDVQNPLTVYAGTDSGVFRTTDGGETWVSSRAGLPTTGSTRSIVQDPLHPSVFFCSVFGAGVFESVDGGANWSPLYNQNGLPSLNVYTLALDASLSTLYAGTDAGVSDLSGYPLLPLSVGNRPQSPELSLAVWPNPARGGAASIRYVLSRAGSARLSVYGVSGECVRVLVDRRAETQGPHVVTWNRRGAGGRPVSPGLYFIRLESAEGNRTARLVIDSR